VDSFTGDYTTSFKGDSSSALTSARKRARGAVKDAVIARQRQRHQSPVDDPQDLAEAGRERIDDRLPARAFVKLGVAQQGNLPPASCRPPLGDRRSRGATCPGRTC
jgi:hypothetical protein